ncbi:MULTISPECIES: aldo/keto reductase [Ramlibacter]|uniref:Aldo/keto reductase n=1 Tax=Ramlibacter pinisoli TaxID=2682844 RepID=A0A6N8IZU8_9BURK|nr:MULTISPECIES: aldo/keto reductase [Ramlibacter]MBA2961580.1 aldo/keto reductase [Ramlibacter sp. CGMCC 1.13660]MVQ31523.1 aldo/keto reductase [Ramlibacter pinisoli]
MERRTVLRLLGCAAAVGLAPGVQAAAPLTRPIPSSGEPLPLVGLGTWITFNVGNDRRGRQESTEVLRAFFDAGGRLVDSSPMYGSSQGVVGEGLDRLGRPGQLFSADKVWTSADGAAQAEASRRLWGVPRFDLLQVHNLLAWEKQLPLLFAMKEAGRVRHVGITTSEGRRHREFEQLMRRHPLDTVQFTYNPVDREAEERLLPLARERGTGVLANRPFREGELTQALRGKPLPGWAAEIGCTSWAQAVLKFIVSHPAVTCAIPATTSVAHVRENLAAAAGPMPDEALRRRIAADVARLA